jgi:hypothetical protein
VRVNDMVFDGPAASAPGRALITLDDGRILEGRVDGSRGSAAFPLDDAALLDKFVVNCGSHSRAQELADRVFGLADEPDLTAVLDLAADISR